ncbi:hypothetical protein [Denitrobaculum tricleocarpae]|uniref:DUF748 domain-containing protein n=1 Tax=Denitrobaculum tricleocarpae TaxID=2591009 RepID=A0A545TP11_9PROT|nr:hypothetical protein [Denitrobaculum tricleocarpae]TQV78960.1 hypothetical protein FKG95_14835 [Denitrobaculum tricleocarpae]
MELIIILLGEFLLFPVITAIGALVNLLAGVVGLTFELTLFTASSSGKKKTQVPAPARPKRKFPFRIAARIAGASFIVVLALLVAVNMFLFEPTAHFIASKVQDKTKMEISFSSVSGNVFSGRLKLEQLQVQRENHAQLDFDISVQSASLDIDVFSLLSNPISIETLAVNGVKGAIWHKAEQRDASLDRPDEPGKSGIGPKDGNEVEENLPIRRLEAKKAFVINDLAINDVELDVHKNSSEPISLALNQIQSAPFRSNYAVFDTFFRSNIEGSLSGHEITISTEETDGGRKTRWKLDNLPVNLINSYVRKAPFSWFRSGTIDILVEDEWQRRENAEIEMDWNMLLKGVVVEAPEDASLLSKALAYPLANYINEREDDVDLRFSFVMNEKQFENTLSLDAAGLWDAALDALSKKIADLAGRKKEEIKQGVEGGIQGFKDFLDKKRNKE